MKIKVKYFGDLKIAVGSDNCVWIGMESKEMTYSEIIDLMRYVLNGMRDSVKRNITPRKVYEREEIQSKIDGILEALDELREMVRVW